MIHFRNPANAFAFFVALGLSPTTLADSKKKNNYVDVGMAIPTFSLLVDTIPDAPDTKKSSIEYAPDLASVATVGLSVQGFSIGGGFNIPGSADESNATASSKTKTKFSSYDASYYFDHIGISLSYTALQGMNIINASDGSDQDLATDPEAHRQDITVTSQSANLLAAPLSYNFSLSDFYDPASSSHGSGLALVMVGSYDTLKVTDKSVVFPRKYSPGLGSDKTFTGGDFRSYCLQAGPAIVLDLYGFYLSALGSFGEGDQQVTYTDEVLGEEKTSRISEKTEFFVSAGFKGSHMFTMAQYAMESPSYALNSVTIGTSRTLSSMVIGVRF